IAIISGYLPKQMSDDEMKAAIEAAVKETGAAGMKDMGKVIGVLRGKYAGQMDMAKASGMVKARLAGGNTTRHDRDKPGHDEETNGWNDVSCCSSDDRVPCRSGRSSIGAGLPEQADPRAHHLERRRHQRHLHARARRGAAQEPRPADHHR